MDSEFKWLFVMMGVLFAAMFAALAVSSNAKSECKIAAIQAHASAEVVEACNKE